MTVTCTTDIPTGQRMMSFMRTPLIILLTVCACGSNSKKNNPDGSVDIDAKEFLDAPVNVPAMITISGVATSRSIGGTNPERGVTVGAYRNSDEATAVATATTDAQGKYTLTITTNGMPLDGFVKASKTGFVDTYLYPPAPLVADFDKGAVNMLTSGNNGNYNLLSTLAQGNQQPGNGVIALIVQDAAGMPVAGATVSSTPASNPYRYDGTNGLPNATATATEADGIAYMFNAPSGAISVTAMKSGATFKAHSLKVHPDCLTTTLVTE